jgi:hypothetical protein
VNKELNRRARQRRLSAEPTDNSDTLASDILRGAKAIAAFVGIDIRQCFHKLEHGHLPALKEGGVWVTTRLRLRAHYNGGTPRAESPSRKVTEGAR